MDLAEISHNENGEVCSAETITLLSVIWIISHPCSLSDIIMQELYFWSAFELSAVNCSGLH